MIINNPYTYHPHPLLKAEADDICLLIERNPDWNREFDKGKMLGVMLCEGDICLRAYSGIVNISDPDHYFVPPVYDLSNPDDFYLQEDEAITALNNEIAALPATSPLLPALKQRRKELSLQLQLKIFSHFNFVNARGIYKNVVDIFSEAKRGLPPGGTGECAAPRLLQYALTHGLQPVALAEFWYGQSPRQTKRVHKQFYPSCIEKCSPIIKFMMDSGQWTVDSGQLIQLEKRNPSGIPTGDSINYPLSTILRALLAWSLRNNYQLIYEDNKLVVLHKPGGLLSSPAKDLSQPNVEDWLKARYPECKLPNLLAHRLDQATRGLLVAALDAETHKWLQQGFEQRLIKKRYLAWLEGTVQSECGVINLPICTNPDDRPRQTVDWQFGKQAVTRYNVVKRVAGKTLIEFFPQTGRTHQLRLHAASIYGLDCPIVGDTLYSFKSYEGQLQLFAQRITLPDGRTFIADGEKEFCGEYVQ